MTKSNEQFLNKQVAIRKVKRGMYHLRVIGSKNAESSLTFTLRGDLAEVTPEAVVSLAQTQKTRAGIYCKCAPQHTESGIVVESTGRCRPEAVAHLVAYLLGLRSDKPDSLEEEGDDSRA